jgi:NodT family efflux transporter outer membrane factor (OMF) lipoprotein
MIKRQTLRLNEASAMRNMKNMTNMTNTPTAFSPLLFAFALTLLSACASTGETTAKPETSASASMLETAPKNHLQKEWWRVFNDPLIDWAAERVKEDNLDIKIAETRLREARALSRVARSDFFPQINAGASAARGETETPTPQTLAQAGFDAAWEIDIFGRTRASLRAANARAAAQEASIEDVRNIVIADIVRAVIEWRQAQQTIAETRDLLAAQDDQVSLLDTRTRAGLIDGSFLERARAERAQTAAQLPLAEAAAERARYQVERLLGIRSEENESENESENENESSARFAQSAMKELAVPPAGGVLAIPLEVIRARPDVRAAQANLLAAQADLDRAEAELWPQLSLSAFFGVQDGTSGPRLAGNPIWSVASMLTAPLLNFGRLRGQVKAADARADGALLAYENTVNLGLQEAKTALADYLNGINAVNAQADALRHRQDTVKIATEKFTRGLTDMTDLTTAQTELDLATIELIERKAAAAIAFVRLQKALGVGPNSLVSRHVGSSG